MASDKRTPARGARGASMGHATAPTKHGAAKKAPPPHRPLAGALEKLERSKREAALTEQAREREARARAEREREARARAEQEGAPEHVTFAAFMAGVSALPTHGPSRVPGTSDRVEARPAHLARARAEHDALEVTARAALAALVHEGLRFEVQDDGERLEGRRVDVDPREVRRLRRGKAIVDATLDLHGSSAEDARKALAAFVRKHAKAGDRVLLVVHGKGRHSPAGRGVLRGEIGAWLSQGAVARHVAAFATPPEELGGGGALLVLLAKS
jgi:DNA-nicking Smr family endonuclease